MQANAIDRWITISYSPYLLHIQSIYLLLLTKLNEKLMIYNYLFILVDSYRGTPSHNFRNVGFNLPDVITTENFGFQYEL